MLPTGRLNDDSRRRGDADATPPFRSMMMSRPVVPPPPTGSRLQSTESAKSAVSEAMSAASSSDAGSFWGLGPAAPSSLVYEPPPSDLKSAPPRLAVIRQQSSISTAAGPPARLNAAMFGDAPANDSFPNAADASDRARSSSSSSSTSGSWNVTSASLQPLPPFFPVERTHAVLESSPNPKEDEELEEKGQEKREDEVSAAACRIAKCLDDLCIAAVYDDERAVCLATTGDRCRFCIRFFRIEKGGVDRDEEGSSKEDSAASGESDKEEGCVLLELQRRRGSCLSFRSAAREILRAAKSTEPSRSAEEGSQRSSSSSSPTSVEVRPPLCPLSFSSGRQDPASEQEGLDQEEGGKGENKEEEECPAAACIDNVVRLLTEEGGRIDAQLLAIDSLRCVSDADRTNRGYARKAARKVLFCGKAESVKCREALMRILSARRHGGGRGSEEDQEDEDDEPDNLEAHFIDEMRGLALSALANSLEAAAASPPAAAGEKEERGVTDGTSSSSKIPLDALVPSLLGDVLRLPPSRPHDAAEAARCLTGLLRVTATEASSPDFDSDIGPRSLSSHTFGILHGLGARDRIARLREEETVIVHSKLCMELDALLGAYDEASK